MTVSIMQSNPLTDPIIPAIRSVALVTADSIGLFTALANHQLSTLQLAEAVGLNPLAAKHLADVLVADGYLKCVDDQYELTEVSQAAFTEGGALPLANWVKFCQVQLRALSQLETALRHNQPIDLFNLMAGDTELLTHQRAMAETAQPAAEWIAANMPVPPGATTLLDVGGSHGVYAAALCQHNPSLRAEALELPAVVKQAQIVSQEYGTDRFIRYIAGDIVTITLTRQYDVVFLGNIIHHLPRTDAQNVIEKLAAHTVPGGTIAIWDITETDTQPDEVAAGFSLLFYLTSGAQCYSETEITELLKSGGFEHIQVTHLSRASTHSLYTAQKL